MVLWFSDFALLHQGKKMYEHNALGYWSGLALCLTKVRSSRARCPATALIFNVFIKICKFDILYYLRYDEKTMCML